MKKLLLSAAALAAALPVFPAAADPPPWAPAYGRRAHDAQAYNNGYYNQGYSNQAYDQGYSNRTWRGEDGRTYCRRSNGTTGLLVGGGAGALIGRAIDGGRNRTVGTILGAAGGALLGREVQRSSSRSRCR